jgi:hypothetical protein
MCLTEAGSQRHGEALPTQPAVLAAIMPLGATGSVRPDHP